MFLKSGGPFVLFTNRPPFFCPKDTDREGFMRESAQVRKYYLPTFAIAAIIFIGAIAQAQVLRRNEIRTVPEAQRGMTIAALQYLSDSDPVYSDVPTSIVEIKAKVEAAENPWRMLGIAPSDIHNYLISYDPIGDDPVDVIHGLMAAESELNAKQYKKHALLKDVVSKEKREAKLYNRRKLEARYERLMKWAHADLKKASDYYEYAKDRNDITHLDAIKKAKDIAAAKVYDLKSAYKLITNPESATAEIIRIKLLKNLYEFPETSTRWETKNWATTSMLKTGNYGMSAIMRSFGGAVSFGVVEIALEVGDIVRMKNPDQARERISKILHSDGLLSMMAFGVGADIPRMAVIDLFGEVIGPRAKGGSGLRNFAARVKNPQQRMKIEGIVGQFSLVTGTLASNMFDRVAELPEYKTMKAALIEEKNQYLHYSTSMLGEIARLNEQIDTLKRQDPTIQGSAEVLCKAGGNPDGNEHVTQFCGLELRRLALNAKVDKTRAEAFKSRAKIWAAFSDVKPGEGNDFLFSITKMIMSSIVSKQVEHLLYSGIRAMGARAAGRFLPVAKLYADEATDRVVLELLQHPMTGNLALGINKTIERTVTTEAFDIWAGRFATTFLKSFEQTGLHGFVGVAIFMETQKLFIDPIFEDIIQTGSLVAWYERRSLDRVVHISDCLLTENSKATDGCYFGNSGLMTDTKIAELPKADANSYALTSNAIKGRAELTQAIANYHWAWERYREKVIMRGLNAATAYYKKDMATADNEAESQVKMLAWIESCHYNIETLHGAGPNVHFNAEMFQQGQSKQLASIMFSYCQGLPQFGDGSLSDPNERWRAEDHLQFAIQNDIQKQLPIYFNSVVPKLQQARNDFARDYYNKFDDKFHDINKEILRVGEILVSQLGDGQNVEQPSYLIDPVIVTSQICTPQVFLQASTGQLNNETGKPCMINMLTALAAAHVTVFDYDAIGNLRDYRRRTDVMLATAAARTLYWGAFFTNKTQQDVPGYLKGEYVPDVIADNLPNFVKENAWVKKAAPALANHGFNQNFKATGLPYNMHDSYQREYADLIQALRPVYANFWQRSGTPTTKYSPMLYKQLMSLPPMAVKDGTAVDTFSIEELPVAAASYYAQLQKEYVSTKSNRGLLGSWSDAQDLLSQIIQKTQLSDAETYATAAEAALNIVVKTATPISSTGGVPKSFPQQLYRTDLVAGPIAGILTQSMHNRNLVPQTARDYMKFGEPGPQMPTSCRQLGELTTLDYSSQKPEVLDAIAKMRDGCTAQLTGSAMQ
jgi:hypothetical protein